MQKWLNKTDGFVLHSGKKHLRKSTEVTLCPQWTRKELIHVVSVYIVKWSSCWCLCCKSSALDPVNPSVYLLFSLFSIWNIFDTHLFKSNNTQSESNDIVRLWHFLNVLEFFHLLKVVFLYEFVVIIQVNIQRHPGFICSSLWAYFCNMSTSWNVLRHSL